MLSKRERVCRLCRHWSTSDKKYFISHKGICRQDGVCVSLSDDTCDKWSFIGYIPRVRCVNCREPLYMQIEEISRDWLYQSDEALEQMWLWVHSSGDPLDYEHRQACIGKKLKSVRLVCCSCTKDNTKEYPQVVKDFKKLYRESNNG